jgi:hypothetical protein
MPIIHDGDAGLINVVLGQNTPVPAGSLGWKVQLNQSSANTWVGEKVLASSTTFNNQILFTTYTPNTTASTSSCSPGTGTNRLYVLDLFNGGGTFSTLAQKTGIAPSLAFLFPGPVDDGGTGGGGDTGGGTGGGTGGTSGNGTGGQQPVVCMSGAEVLNVCKSFNSRIKTYWKDHNAN